LPEYFSVPSSYLVTLARSAKADYLVSGDGDLTSLERPQPPVITPAGFLASLDTDG
jgi:predicted nucleic acid-binding protein